MPASNLPEQIRINAIRSRCALFIFAWILNTNAEKSSSYIGSIIPLSDFLGSGEVVILRKCCKKGLHTEVGQSRSEKYRREFSFADQLLIKFCTCTVQKLNLFYPAVSYCASLTMLSAIRHCRWNTFSASPSWFPSCVSEKVITVLCCSGHNTPLKFFSGTDRPVDRTGSDPKFLFNIIQQFKGIHSLHGPFY